MALLAGIALVLQLQLAFFGGGEVHEDQIIEREQRAKVCILSVRSCQAWHDAQCAFCASKEAMFDTHMVMRIKHSLQQHKVPITLGQCAHRLRTTDFAHCRPVTKDGKLDVTLYGSKYPSINEFNMFR